MGTFYLMFYINGVNNSYLNSRSELVSGKHLVQVHVEILKSICRKHGFTLGVQAVNPLSRQKSAPEATGICAAKELFVVLYLIIRCLNSKGFDPKTCLRTFKRGFLPYFSRMA